MKFFKDKEEGKEVPFGYGLCYLDVRRKIYVCAPLGCNVIINVARRIYYWLAEAFFSHNPVEEAYWEGRRQGRKEADNGG